MISTLRELSMRGPVRAPKHARSAPAAIPAWRWISLLAVIAALIHVQIQAEGRGLGAVLAGCRFIPSAAVLESWSLLLVVALAYAVFQLGEDQRRLTVYDRASRPLALLCALTSAVWEALARGGGIAAAVTLMTAAALVARVAYLRVHGEIAAGRGRSWLGLPFSLLLAYTGGIAVSAIDAALVGVGAPSTPTAIVLIAGAALAVIRLGLSHRDASLPALVAWILASACAARPPAGIATVALSAAAICATASIVIGCAHLGARRQ